MYIEPTITLVPSGFSGYIWFNTKIVVKKHIHPTHMGFHMHFLFTKIRGSSIPHQIMHDLSFLFANFIVLIN